jgi:hypothetical protein
MNMKLAQDISNVVPYRGTADDQGLANVIRTRALGKQGEHFTFAFGEL